MPTRRGEAQRWVLDTLIGLGGFDVLHPGADVFVTHIGYDPADFKRVMGPAQSGPMVRDRFALVAMEVEKKARHWDARGYRPTARRLYHRAALLYGRAFYSYYSDDPRRARYQACCNRCFDKVIEYTDHPVERVALPFAGQSAYGLFETPPGATGRPCVIMLPGMDMFKEDWHQTIATLVVPRGWAAFSFDGPGQGESLTHGLKVGLDNYEQAVSGVIDWLEGRPEVDGGRIVLLGTSMGSYWGTRAAAREPRLKAIATTMANYGSKHIIFNVAQPNFKTNFMYMAGVADEEAFDALARRMVNDELYADIRCPTLMVTGEYDELTPLEDTLAVYERIRAPKELWVFGEEFHPIGPAAGEWLAAALDWLADALVGGVGAGHARKVYITRTGDYVAGTGEPPYWHPPR